MSKHQESFPVLSISREDVTRVVGYDLGTNLTDEQMRRIATMFAGVVLEPDGILADVVEFWLEIEGENNEGGQA